MASWAVSSNSGRVSPMSAGLSLAVRKSNSTDITLLQLESRAGRGFVGLVGQAGVHAEIDDGAGGFAALFFDEVDAAGDGAAFAAIEHGGFLGDDAFPVNFEGGMIEGAPAEGVTGLDDFVETFPFALALHDGFLGAEVGAHDFDEREAAAADFGDESLADDPAQGVGEADADLFLFFGLEHAEDAVDGEAGVNGVERAEDEVAGFGGAEGDFDGGAVAHFADENDLGGLAQGGAQAVGEAVEVLAEFALIDGGLFLGVAELDGIFERHDVDRLHGVDLVDDGGEGGGFAGAGGAGDEDEAGFFPGGLEDDFREVQFRDGGDDGVEFAQDNGVVAALLKDVDTKAGAIAEGGGGIAGAAAQQILGEAFAAAQEVEGHHLGLVGSEPFDVGIDFHGLELAGHFHLEGTVDGEDDVGDVLVVIQQGIQDVIEFVAAHGDRLGGW